LRNTGLGAPFSSTGRANHRRQQVEQASEAGIEDVIILQSDGTQRVEVQRTDPSLDDPKAGAIADNRPAEIGLEWGPADLKAFFTEEQIQEVTGLSDGSTER
jgi:hypothetical protein